MIDEDAKLMCVRLARRHNLMKTGSVEGETSRLANFCGRLEWHPILPGTVQFMIMGVQWDDDGEGQMIDNLDECGEINYETGWFRFDDGVGICAHDDYVARYVYDPPVYYLNLVSIPIVARALRLRQGRG